MVSVSGYLIGSREAGKMPLPPKAELEWWYQYYFATERGRAGYDKYRRDFAKLIWQLASPKWDSMMPHSIAAQRPSTARIMSASWSIITAGGSAWLKANRIWHLEKRLAESPVISVPTISLEGDANGAPHPDASSYAKKFSGKYAHRIIKGGIGHNLPQEAPQISPNLWSMSTVIDQRWIAKIRQRGETATWKQWKQYEFTPTAPPKVLIYGLGV
jgi:pimeloyl-ACP methyl ester carboxylesterase